MKKHGYVVPWKVEYYQPFYKKRGKMMVVGGGTRQDKWGCIDIDCLKPCTTAKDIEESGYWNYIECHIQVCNVGSRNEHIKKIRDSEAFKYLMHTPCIIELWCWHCILQKKKDGSRGKIKKWEVQIQEIKED